MSKPKILAFAGSLRKESYNKKLVKAAAAGAEAAGGDVTFLDLADFDMPIFNEDVEKAEGFPGSAQRLQKLMIEADGFLISCPEYNSMMPAAIKNAIDWVSRKQEGQTPLQAFQGKTAVIMSASPGGLGGIRGLPIFRLLLANLGVNVLAKQRAVSKVHEELDENGKLKSEKLADEIAGLGKSLVEALT